MQGKYGMKSVMLASLVGLTLSLPIASPAAAQEQEALPPGDGKALVSAACTPCHGLKALFVFKGDDRKWEILVHEMVAFGAPVTPAERDTILKYLQATFSTDRSTSSTAGSSLPAGKGQEIVQTSCVACHGTSLIARKRAERAEWESILKRHTSEERVKLSSEQLELLLSYLSTNLRPGTGGGASKPQQNRR
jgi:mono/diheme cytochrome c family protein